MIEGHWGMQEPEDSLSLQMREYVEASLDGLDKNIEMIAGLPLDSEEREQALTNLMFDSGGDMAEIYITKRVGKTEKDIPQDALEILMQNVAFYYTSDDKYGDGFNFEDAIEFVNSITQDTWRFEPGKELFIEKVYRTFPKISPISYRFLHELENVIGQQYYIRPEIFLEVAADAYSNPHCAPFLREEMLHSFNYQFAFASDRYDTAIKDALDFEHPEKFTKTAGLLSFARGLFVVGQGEGFSEDRSWAIADILKKAVEEKKGSYFLNTRARILLKEIEESNEGFVEREWDKLPFMITPGIYAWKTTEGLGVCSKEDSNEIEKLKEEYEDLIRVMPYQRLKIENIFKRFREIFDTETLVLHNPAFYLKNSDSDIVDYEFMMSPSLRREFKKDFGVELESLGLHTQFQMLLYLKAKNLEEVKQVQVFAKKFGKEGLKAFLSLEYGRDFGDKIVNFATQNPEKARTLFTKYSDLIDEVDRVVDEIVHKLPIKEDVSKDSATKKVRDTLTLKGRKLLESIILDKSQEVNIQVIERLNTDVVAYGALIKSLQGTGITFDQIAGARIETKQGGEFTEEEKELMRYAFTKNREESDPKILRETSEGLFEQALQNQQADFRVLYFEDKPVAFVRFERVSTNEVYAGSLNTAPELKGEYIATKFLINELMDKNKEYDITAHVWDKRPLAFYKKRCGFEEEGEILNWHDTGERFVKLRIPKGKLASHEIDE